MDLLPGGILPSPYGPIYIGPSLKLPHIFQPSDEERRVGLKVGGVGRMDGGGARAGRLNSRSEPAARKLEQPMGCRQKDESACRTHIVDQ